MKRKGETEGQKEEREEQGGGVKVGEGEIEKNGRRKKEG